MEWAPSSEPWTPECGNTLPVTVTLPMSKLKSERAFRTCTVTRKLPAMQRERVTDIVTTVRHKRRQLSLGVPVAALESLSLLHTYESYDIPGLGKALGTRR